MCAQKIVTYTTSNIKASVKRRKPYLWTSQTTIEALTGKNTRRNLHKMRIKGKPKWENKKPIKIIIKFYGKELQRNSPALTPEAAAALPSPFFLIIKLPPINPLESKARMKPMRLSLEKAMLNHQYSSNLLNFYQLSTICFFPGRRFFISFLHRKFCWSKLMSSSSFPIGDYASVTRCDLIHLI